MRKGKRGERERSEEGGERGKRVECVGEGEKSEQEGEKEWKEERRYMDLLHCIKWWEQRRSKLCNRVPGGVVVKRVNTGTQWVTGTGQQGYYHTQRARTKLSMV